MFVVNKMGFVFEVKDLDNGIDWEKVNGFDNDEDLNEYMEKEYEMDNEDYDVLEMIIKDNEMIVYLEGMRIVNEIEGEVEKEIMNWIE
ncbi:MAG: hypothetical protein LC687_05410 [Actinobacteria bacterium]|nr:hypothetical protein [Actinomycetota bacterium]MCA1807268.1 hypothetical protein [Actinomycetota bacterium]